MNYACICCILIYYCCCSFRCAIGWKPPLLLAPAAVDMAPKELGMCALA